VPPTAEPRTRWTAVADPLRNPGYRRYFIGQSVSTLGDGVVPATFALAVLRLSGSGWGMPAVLLALWVSRTVFIGLGGSIADRRNRASVMLAADVVRIGAQASVAIAFCFHAAQVWELVASAAVYGAATAFFVPAGVGLIPRLVRPEQRQRANSLLGSARNVGLLLGPAAAAVMVAVGGVQAPLFFDSLTFAVSVYCLAGLRHTLGEPASGARPGGDDEGPVRFRDALPVLARMRTALWIVIVWCFVQIGVASINVLGPIISQTRLGGTDRWSVLLTAMAIGGLGGSALAGSLRTRRPATVILLLLAVPLPVQLLALAAPAGLVPLAASFIATSVSLAICGVLFDTYLQDTIPSDMLSRASSAESGLTGAMIPLGLAICLPLAKWVGSGTYLGTLSALIVAVAAIAVWTLRSAQVERPGVDAWAEEEARV